MKFAHAADLHIDSPLRGLEQYEGAPVERVRYATRAALENLIRICLEEEISFLVIAGDLFDYDWRDFNTALFVVKQFQLLARANIPVFIIRGNHDAREEMSLKVPWPSNVKVLDYRNPETVRLDEFGVALHGMSFPRREVNENLLGRYPHPIKGLCNIGLLHTNATCSTEHAAYAPCTVIELAAKGYDYWALGHVHEHAVLNESPYVVYAGNTQGRHIRENGAKGFALVTVDGGMVTEVEFRATDVLRWFRASLALENNDGVDDLLGRAKTRMETIAEEADGRLAAVRVELQGPCGAHRELVKETSRQEFIAAIRALPGEFTDDLWVEKVKLNTRPTLDRDALRDGRDLIGDLLRDIDAIASDHVRLLGLSQLLQPLMAKVANECVNDEIDFTSAEQLVGWLRSAEAHLLSYLTEGNP